MKLKTISQITCASILAICTSGAATSEPPTTLKAAYTECFAIGAAIPNPNLSEAELTLLDANFTNVTPENCLKPAMIQPAEERFTFESADAMVSFAQKNGLKVNGHTLVWHESCPEWFFFDGGKLAGRDLALQRMRNHIKTTTAHFRGKVASWDVVNEALGDKDDYLRQSNWFACIGEDYIAEAFIAAHEGDPEAKLYYNDYGIETPAKREKALRLIRELKARKVPIDGIGIQGHWCLDKIPFKDIEDSIVAFQAEGLEVMITELDLDVVPRETSGAEVGQKEAGSNDPYLNGCPPEILQRQAEQYHTLFALFRKYANKVTRVTFWGLHDGRTWLNAWPRKRTNYPLFWGRDLQPKPAFSAVLMN